MTGFEKHRSYEWPNGFTVSLQWFGIWVRLNQRAISLNWYQHGYGEDEPKNLIFEVRIT